MSFLYGSYDEMKAVSKWQPEREKSYPHDWPDKVDVGLLLDSSYVEADGPKHLLVTWAIPKETFAGEYTCHSCGVLLGLAKFAKDSDNWRLEASNLQYGEYGELASLRPALCNPLVLNALH